MVAQAIVPATWEAKAGESLEVTVSQDHTTALQPEQQQNSVKTKTKKE